MLEQWERDENERREISSAIWEKLKDWCRVSDNPPILLTHENFQIDQFRMEADGCHFVGNFLISYKKEAPVVLLEEYGPTHYFLSTLPRLELQQRSTINIMIDVFHLSIMRKVLDFFINGSVSYHYCV